jgi:DNA (cytosine-5)-methyltransferase 1
MYLTGHLDLFPEDCFGPSNRKSGMGRPLTLDLAGLGKKIKTDIPVDARTGKPRRQFRERTWVGDFFAEHKVRPGDMVCLERVGARSYRVSVAAPTDRRMEKTMLEFFAGIGLVRMGFEKEGWRVIYANDVDAQKYEMYAANFSGADSHFELADVHRINGAALPSATLATASFPCTDLSLAGERRGLSGSQSSAFFGFVKVLSEMGDRRPPLVLLENVLGFLTSHDGKDFHKAMLELSNLSYSVDPFVLDARWFVPQSRPRLFVAACMHEKQDAGGVSMLVSPSPLRPPLLARFITTHPDVAWSLRRLPDPPQKSRLALEDVLEPLDEAAKEWWSPDRAEYLYNQMSPRHREIAERWMKQNRWSYGTVFRRVRCQPDGHKRSMGELRTDGLAGCLRTPKGGSGRQILFKAGYGRYFARLLTPRECARLMGADDFVIDVPLNQALFAFGDAVCVPAISWIARNYLNPLVESAAIPKSSG